MTDLKRLISQTLELQGKSYEEIAAWLNERPLINNPEPQVNVPKPLKGVDELFGLIMDEPTTFEQDMAALGKCAAFLEIGKSFSEYCDIPYGGPLAEVVVLLQNPVFGLSNGTAEKVKTRLAEEIPDPNWQAQIEGSSRAQSLGLFPLVTAANIQEALTQ